MKKLFALTAILAVLAAPALAQSDTTATIFQGLKSLNSSHAATAKKTPTTLDSLKTTLVTKAGMYAIDTDHDGTVSKAEMNTLNNKLFEIADKNKDGQLTEDELKTFADRLNKVLSFLH